MTYVPNSYRLATRSGSPVVHDGMGNITADSGIVSFGYDAGGRLQTLTRSPAGQPVQTVTNQYNGKGERTFTHRVLSPTLRFVEYYTYAEDGRLLTFVQAAQNTDNTLGVRTVYNYIWLDNIPVAQFRERYSSTGAHMDSQLTYIHADHLYTPQMGTGYSATTQSHETWVWNIWSNAYGYTYEYDNPDGDGSSVNIVLRFPGQVYYGISTFNYNYKRDYDTMGGRYLESDPIGLDGGLNSYAYANGNPLRYADPFGLFTTLNHVALTFEALRECGFSLQRANELAWAAAAGDWTPTWPIAQAIENAHWHAMARPGQTVAQARIATEGFIKQQVGLGTTESIGRAIHAAQDSAARGHKGYQTYDGQADIGHLLGDELPTLQEIRDAIRKTKDLFPDCGCE